MPYNNAAAGTSKYCFCVIFCNPQHHNTTITANKPICTHLSNHILLNQSSFGKAEPGKTSRMVQMVIQPIAGKSDSLIIKKRDRYKAIVGGRITN